MGSDGLLCLESTAKNDLQGLTFLRSWYSLTQLKGEVDLLGPSPLDKAQLPGSPQEKNLLWVRITTHCCLVYRRNWFVEKAKY